MSRSSSPPGYQTPTVADLEVRASQLRATIQKLSTDLSETLERFILNHRTPPKHVCHDAPLEADGMDGIAVQIDYAEAYAAQIRTQIEEIDRWLGK